MPEFDNTNRGVLFVNDRKESDKHPDRKGSINIEGKEYWISGWIKDTAKGKILSLSVQPKEDKPAEKKDWIKPELREKFNKQDEVVLDDIEDEPVDLNDIPF